MCLIVLALHVHPRYPLVVAANRDEAHARATAPAGWIADAPWAFGGRDAVAGGGWLQVSRAGRLAAVTNVRLGLHPPIAPRSRGALVTALLEPDADVVATLDAIDASADSWGPFNLLAWDGATLRFTSNAPRGAHAVVRPGLHAVSNGAFDAPWPKSTRAMGALREWIDATRGADVHLDAKADCGFDSLFDALADTSIAPDAQLPDTGVGLDLERRLSPAFIVDPVYGTRASTVVALARDHLLFEERRFGPSAAPGGVTRQRIEFARVG